MRVNDSFSDARHPCRLLKSWPAPKPLASCFAREWRLSRSRRYLDGAGREEAKALAARRVSRLCAESMRLTTRLMQIASWLLLQRASTKAR